MTGWGRGRGVAQSAQDAVPDEIRRYFPEHESGKKSAAKKKGEKEKARETRTKNTEVAVVADSDFRFCLFFLFLSLFPFLLFFYFLHSSFAFISFFLFGRERKRDAPYTRTYTVTDIINIILY